MLLPLGSAQLAAVACASVGPSKPERVQFERAPVEVDVDAWANWPFRPFVTREDLKERDRARLGVVEARAAGAGVTGAQKLRLLFYDGGERMPVKGKVVPDALDGWNNSPRKEIAAYRLEQLFLEPRDYVVPTTDLYCMPLPEWRRHLPERAPQIAGTSCVLLNLALWLSDVTVPERLYDPQRFLVDPNYAYHLANFNVLTYLSDHKDQRMGNVLVSIHDEDRHVFAIDNGIAFGDRLYNWFNPSSTRWSRIQVPALPRATVERLRARDRATLDAKLGTLTQMEADPTGRLEFVEQEAPWDPERSVRMRGTSLQLGLTRSEIDAVWRRIGRLLEAVDPVGSHSSNEAARGPVGSGIDWQALLA